MRGAPRSLNFNRHEAIPLSAMESVSLSCRKIFYMILPRENFLTWNSIFTVFEADLKLYL